MSVKLINLNKRVGNMECLNTIYQISSGDRLLTITKSKKSVDIRITKFDQKDSENEIKEDLNIPITMDIYESLVSEMFKGS